jgi:ribosomal protein S18 acetylase RimI-like enzyme
MAITVQEMDHEIWGPCVFLEAEGDPEQIREDYAREAPGWPPLHFAIADPERLDPWYRLGFAQMHAYGKRESGGERFELPDVTLRRGGPADLTTAVRIDLVIHEAQAAPPSYSSFELDEVTHRSNWEETLVDDGIAYFVAEHRGEPVGHTTVYPDAHDDEALHLASTAVLPTAQGRGIGLVLTTHALAHAREQGYPRMWTNWRVTNLSASRYWPARGFEIARIRLVRQLPAL